MNKIIFSILLSIVFIGALASFGLASIVWKTNAIPKMNVSLSYIDSSGNKVLRNYSGVGLNYLEVNQDLSNNYHYVLLHTENYSDMNIELSALGGGMSTSRGTEINGTWRTGLNDNVIKFGSLLMNVEMVSDDIRAVVMNGSYTVNSLNASNQIITMTAAGLLNFVEYKAPATVTITANVKAVPGAFGSYTTIGSDFIAHPPSLSGPLTASSFSQDLAFGDAAPAIDVIAHSSNPGVTPTVDIPSGGDALNGHITLSSSSPNNKVVYTPKEGFSGKDTFQYRLIADLNYSAPATVTVNVGPRPHAVLQDYTSITKDSDAADYTPVADWDSNFTLSVPAKTDMGGDISVNTGKFHYEPAAGFDGTDFVTYTLTDKLAKTITGTAIFEVVPHAVADSVNFPIASPGIAATTLLGNDKGSGLTVVDVQKIGTTNGTPTLTSGNITFTPSSTATAHKEYFTYTIKDSATPARMSSAIVTVNIGP